MIFLRIIEKYLHMSKKICTFAADLDAKASRTCVRAQLIHELKRLTNMEAVRQTLYDMSSPTYSREEFKDELARRVGTHYGLADIREAQLIEPDWKTQPMRAWDDVYENLCREVGAAYGLNDIREA